MNVDQLAQFALPRGCRLVQQDRTEDGIVNAVIRTAELLAGADVHVRWVEGLGGESFVLDGLEAGARPVMIGAWQLELSCVAQRLLLAETDESHNSLDDLAEASALALISRCALVHRKAGVAAATLLRALQIVQNLDITVSVSEQGHSPHRSEDQLVWGLALAHEIGHFIAPQTMTPERAYSFLETAARPFENIPNGAHARILRRAKEQPAFGPLGVSILAREIDADMMAVRSVYLATRGRDRDPSHWAKRLALEVAAWLSGYAFVHRCHDVVRVQRQETVTDAQLAQTVLFPATYGARQRCAIRCLAEELTEHELSTTRRGRTSQRLDEELWDFTVAGLAGTTAVVEKSLGKACDFGLRCREDAFAGQYVLQAREEVVTKSTPALSVFLTEASLMGVRYPQLEAAYHAALEQRLNDAAGSHAYYVAWVVGPDGYSVPHSLMTRHGRLVFVFLNGGPLFESFCSASADTLKPGFRLEKTAIMACNAAQVQGTLGRHLPATRARVVFEGSDEFEPLMQELADDTIWDERSDDW